jgi:hypothetical protein
LTPFLAHFFGKFGSKFGSFWGPPTEEKNTPKKAPKPFFEPGRRGSNYDLIRGGVQNPQIWGVPPPPRGGPNLGSKKAISGGVPEWSNFDNFGGPGQTCQFRPGVLDHSWVLWVVDFGASRRSPGEFREPVPTNPTEIREFPGEHPPAGIGSGEPVTAHRFNRCHPPRRSIDRRHLYALKKLRGSHRNLI